MLKCVSRELGHDWPASSCNEQLLAHLYAFASLQSVRSPSVQMQDVVLLPTQGMVVTTRSGSYKLFHTIKLFASAGIQV